MQLLLYNVMWTGWQKGLRIDVRDLEVYEGRSTCQKHKEKERPRNKVSRGLLRSINIPAKSSHANRNGKNRHVKKSLGGASLSALIT